MKNTTKKTVKKVIPTLVLAGAIVMNGGYIGNSVAYANEGDSTSTVQENTTTQENQSTETINNVEANVTSETNTETSGTTIDTTVEAEVVSETEIVVEAGTVPGDLFYFVDQILEKVKLAITFDDVEKARLLVQYAQERISEGMKLVEEGKTDEAAELFQAALTTQDLAIDRVEGSVNLTQSTETNEQVTVETTAETTVSTEESVEADTVIALDEETQAKVEEIKFNLSNNINALAHVLVKVENPKAQEAIQKNLLKSLAKLDSKLAKYQAKLESGSSEVAAELEVELEATSEENEVEATEAGKEKQDKLAKKEEKANGKVKVEWKEKKENKESAGLLPVEAKVEINLSDALEANVSITENEADQEDQEKVGNEHAENKPEKGQNQGKGKGKEKE